MPRKRNKMDSCKNVIIIDADYADRIAFDLIVNFERMLGRRIPPADLSRWLDCLALDGGLRPSESGEDILCVFIHDKEKSRFDNFRPADFATELNAQAFRDNIGEFTLQSASGEGVVGADEFFLSTLKMFGESQAVERIIVVGNVDEHLAPIRNAVNAIAEKDITLLAMEPLVGLRCKQEILGYSLMSALGIKGEEIR